MCLHRTALLLRQHSTRHACTCANWHAAPIAPSCDTMDLHGCQGKGSACVLLWLSLQGCASIFDVPCIILYVHLGYSDKLSDTTHSNFIGLTCISDLTSTHRLSFATTFSAHAALPQLSGLLLFHG